MKRKGQVDEMQIKNSCKNLPRGALWHVRRGLSWINPADLVGIAFIQLMDEMSKPSENSLEWHKQAHAEDFNVSGVYMRQDGGTPACIILFVRDMYFGIPPLYRWTTVPTLSISRTLAHEVGHHLIAQRGYIYQPTEKYKHRQPEYDEYEEEMANRYAFEVLKKMKKRWYYKLGQSATKGLASHHYIQGMLDWKEKKFKKAADRWHKAWHLDPDRLDAAYWYQRAKDNFGR